MAENTEMTRFRKKFPTETWKTYAMRLHIDATSRHISPEKTPAIFLNSIPPALAHQVEQTYDELHMKNLMDMAELASVHSQDGEPIFNEERRWRTTRTQHPRPGTHPMKIRWDMVYPRTCYRCHRQRHPRGEACPKLRARCTFCNNSGHEEYACFRKAMTLGKDIPPLHVHDYEYHDQETTRQQRPRPRPPRIPAYDEYPYNTM